MVINVQCVSKAVLRIHIMYEQDTSYLEQTLQYRMDPSKYAGTITEIQRPGSSFSTYRYATGYRFRSTENPGP